MRRSPFFSSLAILVFLLGACGDDDGPSMTDTDAGPTTDAGPPTDCTAVPTADGCPTCEDDPDLPWCLTCEEDISQHGCTFAEPAFPGLTAPIEVIRDRTGIAHIYAQTDADAMFASGYVQATDRLFFMDSARRRALGRQAEVFGEGKAGEDELIRVMGIADWGRAGAARAQAENPAAFELAVAWTAGVNRRIDEVLAGAAPMPQGFVEMDTRPERWSVTDPFAIGKLLLFGNANLIQYELLASIARRYLPEVYEMYSLFMPLENAFTMPPDERPDSPAPMAASGTLPVDRAVPARPALPPDASERIRAFVERMRPFTHGASNNWAIDGEHTFNGRPLIASDPHQPLNSPSLFWVHHVNSADAGGTIDAVGFNFAGTPAIQLGHNARAVWTATTTYPDNQDIYDVRATADYVDLAGRGIPILRHTEMVQIRDMAPREVIVDRVPGHGVMLPNDLSPLPVTDGGRRLLYVWTGFKATNEFDTFRRYVTATTAGDIANAAAEFEIGTFNWVSADATGIAYRSGMLVPDRGMPTVRDFAFTIRDGDDPDQYWNGMFLPPEQLMNSTGGARGWIATANNDPFGFTQDGEVMGDPWYYGVFFDPGTRGARIESEITRLAARGMITVEDMQTLQTDTHSVFADHAVPVLEQAWSNLETDASLTEYRGRPELATVVRVITEWNRRMDRPESGAVAFDAFIFALTSRVLSDDFLLVYDPVLSASHGTMIKWTLQAVEGRFANSEMLLQGGRDYLVLGALSDAAAFLTRRFGGVDPAVTPYTWGDFHGTYFGSDVPAFDAGWVATDGGDGTVDVSDANFFADGDNPMRISSRAGPIYRTVYSFDADGTPRAVTCFPRGVSGEPTSPHWDDTLDDWVEGRYRPLLFRRAEIEADMEEMFTIDP